MNKHAKYVLSASLLAVAIYCAFVAPMRNGNYHKAQDNLKYAAIYMKKIPVIGPVLIGIVGVIFGVLAPAEAPHPDPDIPGNQPARI